MVCTGYCKFTVGFWVHALIYPSYQVHVARMLATEEEVARVHACNAHNVDATPRKVGNVTDKTMYRGRCCVTAGSMEYSRRREDRHTFNTWIGVAIAFFLFLSSQGGHTLCSVYMQTPGRSVNPVERICQSRLQARRR